MANQLAEETKKAEAAAAGAPSDAELRRSLAAEQTRAAQLEQQNAQLMGAAQSEWARAEAATRALRSGNTPRPEDPFRLYTEEGVANDPEKQRALLDAGTRGRAREEAGAAFQEAERRRLKGEYEMEQRIALRMFESAHPTVAADEEGFYAAMSKASLRANKQRLNLDPTQMLQMGLQIYQEDRGQGAAVPYTEGGGLPGGRVPQGAPIEEKKESLWKRLYGADDVVEDGDPNFTLDDLTEQYVDKKNEDLVKEGFGSSVRQVRATIIAGQQRRQNAGR